MKSEILCPKCKEKGHKPKVLGYYEDVVGRGDVWLYCKSCKKSVHIRIEDISLDR